MASKKRFIFSSILIISPLLLLGVLEILLRIAGLFSPEPLFLESYKGGKEVYQLNPYVARRYFNPRKVVVPTIYPETFEKNKSLNTIRIFCLGGSSMAGFPFDFQVPFPHQLSHLLRQTYPQYHFEVINLGLSAINSFSVLDLLPEVLNKKPDLILMYMGHNEFYGAYGSASTFSIGENGGWIRFYLKLQKLHLVQLLKSVINLFSSSSTASLRDINLMEQVIAEKKILYRSPRYQHTLTNFRDNLQMIYKKCTDQNIPVISATLISNIFDLPPLGSEFLVTDRDLQKEIQEYLVQSSEMMHKNLWSDALEKSRLAVQLDSGYAQSLYQYGKSLAMLADSQQAYNYLIAAKDRDVIRFRASEDFNQVIQQVARQYKQLVVDAVSLFRQHSSQGLIGSHLICDHLHPNPQGYYLLAKGYYDVIKELGLLQNPDMAFSAPPFPFGVTDLDWNIGLLKIFKMVHHWPFPEKEVNYSEYQPYGESFAGQLAYDYLFNHQNWGKAHYDMAEIYLQRKDYRRARKEHQAISSYFPEDPEPYIQSARSYRTEEKWDSCETAYQQALKFKPGNGMILYQIAIAQWKQKKLSEAIKNMEAASYAPDLNQEQKLNARYYLAGFLGEADRVEQAKELLIKILREHPSYVPAQKLLYQLNQPQKKTGK